MRKAFVGFLAFLLVMAGLLGGVLASAGLCAMIWGPAVLQNQLGNPPNRADPIFWLFMIIMVPASIAGAMGALFAFALPLSHQLGVRLHLLDSPNWQGRLGRWYMLKIMDALAYESKALNN